MLLTTVFNKKPVFMAHVYAGDPTLEFSEKLIDVLVDNGVGILELGIPYADPLADGPVFQEACQRALESGTTPPSVFALAERVRNKHPALPIVLTTYYNVIFQRGMLAFVAAMKSAGIQGLIVPDLPLEESIALCDACTIASIALIYLIVPTTPKGRMQKILEKAQGFVYVTAFSGVTGASKQQEQVKETIAKIRTFSSIPVLIGFGIKDKEDVKDVLAAGADGFIVGSEICRKYTVGESEEGKLEDVRILLMEMKNIHY
ncbi:tryptophan synthase subunit alpha [Candidatus Woesearchaeota archaeon]|nr:tryptophan synthase subunit alpha [Candidatus Woesearchaeota archaeon]